MPVVRTALSVTSSVTCSSTNTLLREYSSVLGVALADGGLERPDGTARCTKKREIVCGISNPTGGLVS